jgi:hypothetical protein
MTQHRSPNRTSHHLLDWDARYRERLHRGRTLAPGENVPLDGTLLDVVPLPDTGKVLMIVAHVVPASAVLPETLPETPAEIHAREARNTAAEPQAPASEAQSATSAEAHTLAEPPGAPRSEAHTPAAPQTALPAEAHRPQRPGPHSHPRPTPRWRPNLRFHFPPRHRLLLRMRPHRPPLPFTLPFLLLLPRTVRPPMPTLRLLLTLRPQHRWRLRQRMAGRMARRRTGHDDMATRHRIERDRTGPLRTVSVSTGLPGVCGWTTGRST